MDYILRHHLAGVMLWELSDDVSDGRLIKTVVSGLRREDADDLAYH
jgi:GH18 family chitinase